MDNKIGREIPAGQWEKCNLGVHLFQRGEFVLNSGAVSGWKIECDALTDADWDGVAAMARQLVPQFSAVTGVPRGGLKLEERLKPFATPGTGPHLIVDDVLTTGGSMEKVRKEVFLRDGIDENQRFQYCTGVVLFARGQCPWWVRAIFQMPETFWLTPMTRG